MRRASTIIALVTLSALLAACGGEDKTTEKVSASQRIEKCVSEYPDSTKADCEEWESDGQLDDEGKHKDHENM